MKKIFATISLVFFFAILFAQQHKYEDSLLAFQKDYTANHEIVKGKQKTFFRFFPVNKNYSITADFEKINDSAITSMKTSGSIKKDFVRYGYVYFKINKQQCKLTIYQSLALKGKQEFENYIFLPFTDLSSGAESYGAGRYLDFKEADIISGKLQIDFNKAYNPYCAYTTGYNCPVPPRENDLPVAIKAGEKAFGKKH